MIAIKNSICMWGPEKLFYVFQFLRRNNKNWTLSTCAGGRGRLWLSGAHLVGREQFGALVLRRGLSCKGFAGVLPSRRPGQVAGKGQEKQGGNQWNVLLRPISRGASAVDLMADSRNK